MRFSMEKRLIHGRKPVLQLLTVSACLALGGLVAQVGAAEGEAKEAGAEEEKSGYPELVVPQSVFLSEARDVMPKKGLDPFFPKSKRRDPAPKGPTPEELEAQRIKAEMEKKKEEAPPPPPDPFDDLTLKGVLGGRRPLATIHTTVKNYYFSPGEWRMVKVPDHTKGGEREVRLECVSVSAESVKLKIDNKPEVRVLELPRKPAVE